MRLWAAFALFALAAQAEEPAKAPLWSPPDTPVPGLIRAVNSPRGAVFDYLMAARRGDYAQAAKHLDLGRFPEGERAERGPVLARQLKVVLDRSLWIDFEQISDNPDGNLDDGLPPTAEQIGTIPAKNGAVNLILRRGDNGAGDKAWKFSSSLVERIPALYDQFGYGWIGDLVPERLKTMRLLNIEAWQAIGLLIMGILAWVLGRVLAAGLARLAVRLARRTRTPVDDRLAETMRRPARWAATLTILVIGVRLLDFSVRATARIDRVFGALGFVTLVLFAAAIAEGFALTARARLASEGQTSGAGVVTVMNRIVKVLLACIGAIGVFHALGFNVTTLLAGLGVGGIAVALAAQKTIENLFGGLTLMADKPVKIGDNCNFGAKTGVVEDIGLRSTKIRTPERTVISIPNSEFSNTQIENLSSRDRMRFYVKLGLRTDTSPDQLRAVLLDLRRLLIGHPKVARDSQVRLVGFGVSSLDVEIAAYVTTPDVNAFSAIREDLLLRAMDIVAAAGTALALPAQTLYLGRDRGVEGEGRAAAEEKIRVLREQNKLPFPDFTPQEISEIADKLDYPARGSSSG